MPARIFRILLLGDFGFGESYEGGGARMTRERGYLAGLEALQRFSDRADAFALNLETPLLDPAKIQSPFGQDKPYVHWSAEESANHLAALGVDAVSLANNHTMDFGTAGLRNTLQVLEGVGIAAFGAGRSLDQALRPWTVDLREQVGGGRIVFHGGFERRRTYEERYRFYAKSDQPGCYPISPDDLGDRSIRNSDPTALHVVFPHWGPNYRWRSRRQRVYAQALLKAGADLVIGHGAHCLQQVERRQRRWVAYGIGNGHFQSPGRYQRYEVENGILPMSAWTMLEVTEVGAQRAINVKLYPVYSDNRRTGFTPHPVSEKDFDRVTAAIRDQTVRPERFDNPFRSVGQDDLGFHILLDAGVWPIGDRPRHASIQSDARPSLRSEPRSNASPHRQASEPKARMRDQAGLVAALRSAKSMMGTATFRDAPTPGK